MICFMQKVAIARRHRTLCFLLAVALDNAFGAAAQDAGRLNALLTVCASCHGQDGVALGEDIPSLGGQNEAYLHGTLTDFKEGKRPSAIMRCGWPCLRASAGVERS